MRIFTRKLDKLGRVVIPSSCRRFLGIREGDRLTIQCMDGCLKIWREEDYCLERDSGIDDVQTYIGGSQTQ